MNGYSPENCYIIESDPSAWKANLETGSLIPIHAFDGDKNDISLMYLIRYLIFLKDQPDMNE